MMGPEDGGDSEEPGTAHKRALSGPSSPQPQAKKPRTLNKETCRNSVDEDDIKVLKSDYTRNLDEEKNKKESEQQARGGAEETGEAPEREQDNCEQNHLAATIKMLEERNIEKDKKILTLSRALSKTSCEIETANEEIERKSKEIKNLEQHTEELHEKQEKILDCLYIEKQLIEKKLVEAQKQTEKGFGEEERDNEILNLNVSLKEKEGVIKSLEHSFSENEAENNQLKDQLSRKLVEMKKKDLLLKDATEKITALERKVSESARYKISNSKNSETLMNLQKVLQNKEIELGELKAEGSVKDTEILRLKAECTKKDSDIDGLYEKCMSKISEVESAEEKCLKFENSKNMAVKESLKIKEQMKELNDSHLKKESELRNLLEETSKDFQVEISEKNKQVEHLERQIIETDSKIKDFKCKQTEMEGKMKAQEENLCTLNTEARKAKEDIQARIKSFDEEKLALTEQIQERNVKLNKLTENQEKLEKENDLLKSQFECSACEENKSKMESLIEQTFEKEIEIKGLLEQGFEKEATIERLTADCTRKDDDIKKLKTSKEGFENKEKIVKELEESRVKCSRKEEEIKKLSERYEEAMKELEETYASKEGLVKSQMKDISTESRKKEDKIIKLLSKVKVNLKRIKELEKSCSKKDEEARKLKSSYREKEEKLQVMSKEIAKKDENLKSLHSQFIEIDEDIKRFRREFEEKDGNVRELEEKAKRKDIELEKMKLIINQKESDLMELSARFGNLEEIVKKLKEFKKTQEGQIYNLSNNENKSKSSIAVLEKQLGRKERRVEELQTLMMKKEKEIKNFREQTRELERESEKQKQIQDDLLTSVEKLNVIVNDQKSDIAKLQTSLKKSLDETVELRDVENTRKENIVENSTQTEEQENFQKFANELHTELVKVKDELLERNNSNRKLRKEIQILKSLNELKSDNN